MVDEQVADLVAQVAQGRRKVVEAAAWAASRDKSQTQAMPIPVLTSFPSKAVLQPARALPGPGA